MKKILWDELHRNELERAVKDDAVIIMSVGSTEQHGNHLPVNTDSNICFSIAQRAARLIDEFPVLVLPVIWTGFAPRHMIYPGTITLKFHTFVELLTQVAASVHAHGFEKIVILNGHGDNNAVVAAMRPKLSAEEDMPLVIGYTYWDLPPVREEMERVSQSDKGFIAHAAEIETSMQLYLQPELVDMNAAVWVPGVWGDPSTATREKGEKIVNAAVNAFAKIIRNIHTGIGMPVLYSRYQKEIVEGLHSPTLG